MALSKNFSAIVSCLFNTRIESKAELFAVPYNACHHQAAEICIFDDQFIGGGSGGWHC